ncbi:MAG: UPF0104 family protein [Planctomycetota bacterium]|nr:MAG: UPF0104 family protein [Planctomycetota bacterium]
MLAHEGVRLPFGLLLGSFLRGRFVGAFTPSTAGLDLYRLVDVGDVSGQRAASGRAILVEKLLGLVALGLVTLALVPAGLAQFFGAGGLLVAVGLGAGSLAALGMLSRGALLRSLAGRLPRRMRRRAHALLDVLCTRPLPPAHLARTLGLGVVSHAAASGVFLATGLALQLPVAPLSLLVVGNAIVLATLLPISVGGVGVREGTAVALLATVGVSPTAATLMAVLGYLAMQPPALLGGLLMLRQRHPRPDAAPIAPSAPTITLAGLTPIAEAPLLAQPVMTRTASSTSARLPM